MAPAETRVPVKYVSSSFSNGNNRGYLSTKGARGDGGYQHKDIHHEKDKDSYGYAAETGFGKTVSSENGEEPSVKDKHSYTKVSRLGNNWRAQDEEKTGDLLDAVTEKEKLGKIKLKKPTRGYVLINMAAVLFCFNLTFITGQESSNKR